MNEKDYSIIKSLATLFIIIGITLIIMTIITNLLVPEQPTFRQRCEENNGIFIENYGRVGNSCIYDKGEYYENKTN